MTKTTWLLSLALTLSSLSFPAQGKNIFNEPSFRKSTTLGESDYAYAENIRQNCLIYSHHAVVEEIDPGLTGSKISLRPKDQWMTPDQLCDEKYEGRQLFLNNTATSFWGSYRNYIFVKAADDFSDRDRFEIYDSLTGENLWSAHRNNRKPFILKKKDNKISLEYYHHLKVFCDIVRDPKGSCWKRVFKDYNIPASVKIDPPKCREAFKSQNVSLSKQAHIFVKVSIRDLDRPHLYYRSAPAVCSPAP